MDVVLSIAARSWTGPFAPQTCERALDALEAGKLLVFAELRFALTSGEHTLLTPALLGGAKNVCLDPSGRLKHASGGNDAPLMNLMERFACAGTVLVENLLPAYRGRIDRARTSFRPAEIEGRRSSPLKDDTRLHVDAFPATPMRGRRILRLFANINPTEPRVWCVGEPFEAMAAKLLPGLRVPPRAFDWLLAGIGATKGLRSRYDDLMLGLHNRAKTDDGYRRDCPRQRLEFAAGTVWLCYTDQVMHAALKGQHALEQTFHVPVEAMAHPERAPLRVLERLAGRRLV